MGESPEVLLIHEGKAQAADCPIHLLPMGLVSMADWVSRSGHPAEILHLPLERALDSQFDLPRAVERAGAEWICFDLHWHQQSHAVIEAARAVRQAHSGARIVLGGYTASAFAEEILELFDFVDYVIRGDGEVPLVRLIEAVDAGSTLAEVPNLTYRTGSGVARSAELHVNGAEDLAQYSFTSFERVRHHRYYTQAGMMEGGIRLGEPLEPGIFYCNCGRGCPYDCLFCGGARRAQLLMGGRERFVYRPVDAMVRDLRRMADHNLDTWYNTFHPTPDESYFLELFDRIRREGLGISMIHECLHLPSDSFLQSFAQTFGERSRLDIVVLAGSESLRRRNKDNYFSNEELFDCLERVEPHGIDLDLCFLTGLPFEQEADVGQAIELAREVGRRFSNVDVNAEILAIEPLSAMSRDPEGCGIEAEARTFMDYYRGHAAPRFVGFRPGAYSAERASSLAREIRDAHAAARRDQGRGDGAAPRRASVRVGEPSEGRQLVQLHDVSLWDDGWHYGLGVPCLVSHATSQPDLVEQFIFEHVPWRAGRDEASDPTPEAVVRAALEASPQVLGLSLTTWSEQLFREVARQVKRARPETIIVAGGPVATGWGADLLGQEADFDFGVCGYGELSFAGLLRTIAEPSMDASRLAKIGGLCWRRDGEVGCSPAGEVLAPHELPSPFRSRLVDPSGCRTFHVEWSRGCLANCGYCIWGNALNDFVVAERARILDDIAFAADLDASEITINSSALNFRTDRLAHLCEAIAEGSAGRAVRFIGFLRYEYLDDEQLELLRLVPWQSLILGVQSDDRSALRAIGRPPLDVARLEAAVAALRELCPPAVQIITALPGDTVERFHLRLERLLSLGAGITVFPLQTPPGSRLYRERDQLGIRADSRGDYYVFETATLTAREHRQCLDRARIRLAETEADGQRHSHGVCASSRFWRQLGEAQSRGKPLVQIHHANVDDACMNFGLGVPFLITHCRAQRSIAARYELTQEVWEVDHPDRFRQTADEMVAAIVADPPTVLGFSLQPWSYQRFLEVIAAVGPQLPDACIVVGGSNASIEGADLLRDHPHIDVVIAGEGERPFAELLRALSEPDGPQRRRRLAEIDNGWARVDGEVVGGRSVRYQPERLDYCGDPLGAGLVYLAAKNSHLNLEWTRGCPNQCTYCAWPRAQHILRRFSAERIAADVRWARERGFDELLICDAAINYDLGMLRELCQAIGEGDPDRQLRFSCFVHWPLVDEDHMAAMAPVPWSRIMIGLQTDDDEGLRTLGRPTFDRAQFERCVRLLHPLSAPYIELMTGVPGDTATKLRRRLDYALSLGARVSMFPLLATRGTRIHQRCVEAGAMIDPDHQYVVASLPTLSAEEYRCVIEEIAGLGVDPSVLEIVGYHFLESDQLHAGPRRPAPEPRIELPQPAAPPTPEGSESSANLAAWGNELLDRLAALSDAERAKHGLGGWAAAGPAAGSHHADLAAVKLTFSDGTRSLSIDAFPPYHLTSPPIAQGERLAFVPSMDQPGGGQPVDQQALRNLCLALAAVDRETAL
ncbi:MAG: cobalamin-dependent protein [Deltaproteobacteria bacterium]|jgi:radical SAM superfamily enzyme YgiQ (UPF0313 family)|nr:cobalamin-dependent protein [Deltaproteobacteria bacterium]MBW2533146.1 cobalamin-dependent protein [Deltaproteobacteria bacterium]